MVTKAELDAVIEERDRARDLAARLEEEAAAPMPRLEDERSICERLAAVTADVRGVGKDAYNDAQNYSFRSYDGIVGAIRASMARHQVVATPYVEALDVTERPRTNRDGKAYGVTRVAVARVRYTFWGPDGQSIDCLVYGEGADVADKAINKALTAAHKYALMQVFLLSTDDDGDHETPELHPARTEAEVKDDDARAAGYEDERHRAETHRQIRQEGSTLSEAQQAALKEWIAAHAFPYPYPKRAAEAVLERIAGLRTEAAEESVVTGEMDGTEPF